MIVAAFPYIWTVWGSLKVEVDFFSRESWWNALFGTNTIKQTGSAFTGAGYYGAWVTRQFWHAAGNTAIVTLFVTISLALGTLGGYALARSGQRYAFWILIAALVFRGHATYHAGLGYLLPFFLVNGDIANAVFRAEAMRVEGLSKAANGPVTPGFRAEDVTLADGGADLQNPIYTVELLGDATMISMRVADALVSVKAAKDYRAEIGDIARVSIPARACHLFDRQNGTRLAD